MLEESALLLQPVSSSGVQPIVAAETGAPLGFVCRPAGPGRSWWQWLLGPALAVHEHEDQPLLFTVRRCWTPWPACEVRDAEGGSVGTLAGSYVKDRYGRRLAQRRRGDRPNRSVFRSSDGRTLAQLSEDPDGVRIDFSAEIANDPFAKMLLLAAVVTKELD